ncbi:MAG: hypothetical protein M1826_004354 [Phylliscum demangeonii]|nr:MAG: hypothetical protein M1826_004354 [Phylliscum demangeonii]
MAKETAAGASAAAKSSHVEDDALRPFLDADFDPVAHLNSVLPALSVPLPTQRTRLATGAGSLADVTARTQTLLSQLNANTARLSSVLTQLADDIVRSGSRLAYEVEVLQGDADGLSDALAEGLTADLQKLTSNGIELDPPEGRNGRPHMSWKHEEAGNGVHEDEQDMGFSSDHAEGESSSYLARLHTLTTVKERLESVIQVFGDAMEWTLPPSEISITSSFISVSAPEPGSDSFSQEERGRAVAKHLKDEITSLLAAENGIELASQRVQQLRELARVWKGTAEEKARNKFVDGLAKLVEDQQKLKHRADDMGHPERGPSSTRALSPSKHRDAGVGAGGDRSATVESMSSRQGGYGFMEQLQRIRGGL